MPTVNKLVTLFSVCLLTLAACSGSERGSLTNPRQDDLKRANQQSGLISGEEGSIDLFSSIGSKNEGGTTGIGVNSFLWRATLDTISFMPLASADPFGGVIITDWYSPPDTPNERIKLNIVIIGKALRADALRTSVFRQDFDSQDNVWRDARVSPNTARKLENAILTKARELKTAQRVSEE